MSTVTRICEYCRRIYRDDGMRILCPRCRRGMLLTQDDCERRRAIAVREGRRRDALDWWALAAKVGGGRQVGDRAGGMHTLKLRRISLN